MERAPDGAGHHRGMILTDAWRHERRPSNISYSLEVPCVNRGRSSHIALRPAHRSGIAAQVRQPFLWDLEIIQPIVGQHMRTIAAIMVGVKIVRGDRGFFRGLRPWKAVGAACGVLWRSTVGEDAIELAQSGAVLPRLHHSCGETSWALASAKTPPKPRRAWDGGKYLI
jgi:hypothetical protein